MSPAVKLVAERHGLRVMQPEGLRDASVQSSLRDVSADVIVVAAYGKILPRAVLAMPKRGCVNVHGSLLPRWRGASPIAAAILAGDDETGVSIMEMVAAMDAGPVISRVAVPLGPDARTGTLEVELASAGARALAEVLPAWLAGDVRAEPQDEALVTYCHTLTKADGQLSSDMSAEQAERAIRAFDPWPGAFVEYRGERLAIWRAHVGAATRELTGSAGTTERLPAIAMQGRWLVLDEVQRPGSRRITGGQLLSGFRGEWSGKVGLK